MNNPPVEVMPVSNDPPLDRVKIFFTLVHLRKRNNISQAVLAEELGMSQGHLSAIETGRKNANPELLHKIAEYFDVEVDHLYLDAPTVEMALQLIAEDVTELYHERKAKLSKDDRQYLLQVVRTLKPQILAEETVVTHVDKDGNRVKESVQKKLAQLGVVTGG